MDQEDVEDKKPCRMTKRTRTFRRTISRKMERQRGGAEDLKRRVGRI